MEQKKNNKNKKKHTQKPQQVVPKQEAHRIVSVLFSYTADAAYISGKLEMKFRLPRTAKSDTVLQ